MGKPKSRTNKPDQVLCDLDRLQRGHEISIIKISEPISSTFSQDMNGRGDNNNSSDGLRTSDVSNSSLDTNHTTPASLEADLDHYRELFAKLRFSYVEQVTKEKFIRAIVGDPPLIVSPQENADLEKQNATAKAQLKALKLEVQDMVAELERRGRELSRRYENVQMETAALRDLPGKIAELDGRIAELRTAQKQGGQNPELSMPLARTLELLEQRKQEGSELDRQLEQLTAQVPRKTKEMERLQAERQTLEAKRQNSATAAKEARRRKEAALGGVEDDLEERGRWWRAADTALQQMLSS